MNYASWLGLALSVFGLLGLALSGPGHRLDLWSYTAGIRMVKYSGFISAAAVLASIVGLVLWWWRFTAQGTTPALIGLVVGGGVLGVLLTWKRKLDSVPYIHDITTDTANPPSFAALLRHRAGAENSADYGGPELAKQQNIGYPDLGPVSLSSPPAVVFPRALQSAQDVGWKIVEADPKSLRIEATDTTLWFGFKDDIVVRLTPAATGTRVDLRSVSRVGQSDLGTNARRIRTFLARMGTTGGIP